MDPKEKAKELIDKYTNDALHFVTNARLRPAAAKQCALISVEEIISRMELLRKPEYTTFIAWDQLKKKPIADTWDGCEEVDYWKQVKEEIEKV